MSADTDTLNTLVTMSRRLGEPYRDLVVVAEGNTSARDGEDEFWVKASGYALENIGPEGFVRCRFDRSLTALSEPDMTDEQTQARLAECTVGGADGLRPSVETFFHAFLLSLPGVNFVGHTHPTTVNSLLCSSDWKAMGRRIFPDQIVCCGLHPCFVEYTDPGLPLAKLIRRRVEEYVDRDGDTPRAILMQNHGLIAIGKTVNDIESITMMAEKTARIIVGATIVGGIHVLSEAHADRIWRRPDEHYRQEIIAGVQQVRKRVDGSA